jgi:hypothetical protein
MATIQERFDAKVERIPFMDCHVWTAATNKFGYGKFAIGNNDWIFAHRFAFERAKGEIPVGKYVLHTCDNSMCVNPDHLYAGDYKQNAKDRENRNRGNHVYGERHGRNKLSADHVLMIRKEYQTGKFSFRQLGKIYGVDGKTVADIVRNKLWQRLN